MALPVTITGISTAVAPVGPFKCTIGGNDRYYFFGRDATTATTLQAYRAVDPSYDGRNTSHQLPAANSNNVWGNSATVSTRRGMVFTTGASASVSLIRVGVLKVGAPTDNLTMDIYAVDGSNLPTGASLGTSNIVAGTSLGTATITTIDACVSFTFASPVALSASTKYCFVLSRSGAVDAANYYSTTVSTAESYTGGGRLSFGTVTWSYAAASDLIFAVYEGVADWSSIATKTGFTTAILNIAGYQVGNVIHLAVQDGTMSSSVATKYLSFDAATNTFLATTETVAAASVITGGAATGWGVSLVVRSNGNAVIFYNGLNVTSMARVYYRERTGLNTYGTATRVDDNTATNNTTPLAVLGAANRVHFFWSIGTTSTGYRTLSAANALPTGASSASMAWPGDGVSYDRSGTIKVVITNNNNGAQTTARFNSADAPTVTFADQSIANATTPHRIGVDTSTDDVTIAYRSSADGDLYAIKSTDDGATFSSPVSLFVGTVANNDNSLSRNSTGGMYQRGSNVVVGYIVSDTGTLKYNEYTVRTVSVDITGTLNVAEAADTISAAGTVAGGAAVTGTLSITEANDTIVAAATVTVRGTLSQTEANDTLSAAATVRVGGTLSVTEANDALSATAIVSLGGALILTEANDTISAAATVTVSGALVVTEANDTLSATGTVEAVATITGALNVTEVDDTVSAAGTVTVSGTLSITEANDTLSAAATVSVTGALNVTEANDTLSAAGIVSDGDAITGALNVTEANDTISALATVAGEVEPPVFAGGGGYAEPPRLYPVEGFGYGILPPIEGEGHGVVSVGSAGLGLGLLPRFVGQATAAIGAAGSSRAQLEIRAAASGQAGAQARGFGMIMKIEGAAVGRQSDDDAAAVTFLLAA